MKLAILDALIPNSEDAETLRQTPEFRRSTYAIAQGASGINKIFARNAELRALAEQNEVALIVGSSVGEIETTRDFLKELALKNTARPFLFQLSSHNSTLGFLSQYFQLRGPSLTISNQYQTGESVLESAYLLLQSGACKAVIAFCFDFGIEGWIDRRLYTTPHLKEGNGAAVLVLTNGTRLNSSSKPLAELHALTFGRTVEATAIDAHFFDSNTLSIVASDVDRKNFGPKFLLRPDSTLTRYTLKNYAE